MKIIRHTLQFTTPCFCAGATQAKPEVRAPSVRGQLRWWFRALGGIREDESALFGGVHGSATASAIQVRLQVKDDGAGWNPPQFSRNAPSSYVWYFASVSGKVPKKPGDRPRWTKDGVIPPGATVELQLTLVRPISPALQKRFDDALSCFLLVGGLGLRITRGLGAFRSTTQPPDPKAVERILRDAGFAVEIDSRGLKNRDQVINRIGALVKGTRRSSKMKANEPSPFGSSQPRQTSAIQFRPVSVDNGSQFDLWVLQAPSDRVLGKDSRKGVIVGCKPTKLTAG